MAFAMLTGCCVSYGRIASVTRGSAQSSPDLAGIVAVIGNSISQRGFAGHAQQSFDGKLTIYSVRNGRDAVDVLIDHQTLAIKIRRDWRTKSEFMSQVQDAIEREYASMYHADLRFEDVPCGLVGP